MIPIYTALAETDGRARPREVEERIYKKVSDKIRSGQWAYVIKTNAIPFTRNALRKIGGLTGETGVWEWTPIGKEYWRRNCNEAFHVPLDMAELSPEESDDMSAPPETVQVTSRNGLHIPILQMLAKKSMTSRQIFEELKSGAIELLPGDLRISRGGDRVIDNTTNFALTDLRANGEISSVGRGGDLRITDTGQARLHKERPLWSIDQYRDSKALVRRKHVRKPLLPELDKAPDKVVVPDDEGEDDIHTERTWSSTLWNAARGLIGEAVFRIADARIRPELGPTPDGSGTMLMRNLILYGPPGTGKTFAATKIAAALTSESKQSDKGRFQLVQFHPNYSYEDFVHGLRPDLAQSGLHYRYYPGPLLQICERADDDPDQFYVLVIDEINRGDPARIFGEALFAMEYRGQEISLASGKVLRIPPNLVIIGTMNSIDRSIALMDFALRRRFGFIHLPPTMSIVRTRFAGSPGVEHAIAVFEQLNEWLHRRIGPEHVLGHSFLLNPALPLDRPGSLDVLWQADIWPLLEEYLFNDRDGLIEIESKWSEWCAKARDAGSKE